MVLLAHSQELLVLVKGLSSQSVGKVIRHIGPAVDHGAGADDGGNGPIDSAQQSDWKVSFSSRSSSLRHFVQQVLRQLEVCEISNHFWLDFSYHMLYSGAPSRAPQPMMVTSRSLRFSASVLVRSSPPKAFIFSFVRPK